MVMEKMKPYVSGVSEMIIPEFSVNKSIIAGLIIDIGSKRLDLSLYTKLQKLCSNTMEAATNT
jgi:F0F1-type ATP synthase delta subunit